MKTNHYDSPESTLKEGCFTITINKNRVEIECATHFGCSAKERTFMPLELLEKFISDYRNKIITNSNACSGISRHNRQVKDD